MSSIIEWIKNNLYWIFDGIGVTIIVGIASYILNKKHTNKKETMIIQKGGKNSINNQNNVISGEKHD